jgi:hypothetical protein
MSASAVGFPARKSNNLSLHDQNHPGRSSDCRVFRRGDSQSPLTCGVFQTMSFGTLALHFRWMEYIHVGVLNWMPAGEPCDLIVTHFFSGCSRAEQLEQLISRLATATTRDANWLLADVQTPAAGLRRLRSRSTLATIYAFFCAVTRLPARGLITPAPGLERARFTRFNRVVSEGRLHRTDGWRPRRSTAPGTGCLRCSSDVASESKQGGRAALRVT